MDEAVILELGFRVAAWLMDENEDTWRSWGQAWVVGG